MLWRYIKALLIVLMSGGLVGPIFLFVYFLNDSETRSLLSWMLVVGLLITVVDLAIAVFITRAGGGMQAAMLLARVDTRGGVPVDARGAASTAALERDGVLVLAQITGMAETGISINDHPTVAIRLRVEGPGFAFDTQDQVIAKVTRMATLNARKVVVLVDPATQAIAIDWDRSALVNGQVAARFTLAEDDTTYDLTGQAGPLLEILRILKAHGVPFDRMVDARSNPALRDQLRAVVRQAAATQATQPEAAATQARPTAADAASTLLTKPKRSAVERMDELDALRAAGVITDTEYAAKRDQIIAEI
ncbi:SHOCT domain-containing protein [Pseudofrankia sp. BMG5.36]|uniref:SHOCT domain-containing protein n=1 Tax=Pseudofrankia sp. BMG5.36 TaxID=1834512 RepID=UPI0008DABF63|nr:SHOCT domain-containing protein [Pseudofrankia sp. BMG5.36]OHV51318.1 hypothetical protein BCD48_10000 [Pseudofrankia sp. BMG5.36]